MEFIELTNAENGKKLLLNAGQILEVSTYDDGLDYDYDCDYDEFCEKTDLSFLHSRNPIYPPESEYLQWLDEQAREEAS